MQSRKNKELKRKVTDIQTEHVPQREGRGGSHRHYSPRARQKSRKDSWAWTPQAWSFSKGGNSLTSASQASTLWGLVEEEEEWEGELPPEENREEEMSVGEAVRRGGDGKEESFEDDEQKEKPKSFCNK